MSREQRVELSDSCQLKNLHIGRWVCFVRTKDIGELFYPKVNCQGVKVMLLHSFWKITLKFTSTVSKKYFKGLNRKMDEMFI